MWFSDNAELRLLNENQKAGAKQINYNFLLLHHTWGSQRILLPYFQAKKCRSASSQTKDTKIPVKSHNDILHLLVEVNDAICVPFLFLSGWLKITLKTLLVGYTFTNCHREGLKSLVLCFFFFELVHINSSLRTKDPSEGNEASEKITINLTKER